MFHCLTRYAFRERLCQARTNRQHGGSMPHSQGPELKLSMEGFPSRYPAKEAIRLTSTELANRSVAVGSTLLGSANLPAAAVASLTAFKAAAMEAVLDFSGDEVTLTGWHPKLERSEKSNLSFWCGMAVTGVLANRILHCSHLTHVSLLKNDQSAILTRAKGSVSNEPDFIGISHMTGNTFHVIEAKGRQKRPNLATQEGWLDQSRKIQKINGCTPATRSFSALSLTPSVSCLFRDPPPAGRGTNINFNVNRFFQSYYRPHLEGLRGRPARFYLQDRVIEAVPRAALPEGGWLYTGLDREIRRQLKRTVVRPPLVRPYDQAGLTIGSDGVATVRLATPCVRQHRFAA